MEFNLCNILYTHEFTHACHRLIASCQGWHWFAFEVRIQLWWHTSHHWMRQPCACKYRSFKINCVEFQSVSQVCNHAKKIAAEYCQSKWNVLDLFPFGCTFGSRVNALQSEYQFGCFLKRHSIRTINNRLNRGIKLTWFGLHW